MKARLLGSVLVLVMAIALVLGVQREIAARNYYSNLSRFISIAAEEPGMDFYVELIGEDVRAYDEGRLQIRVDDGELFVDEVSSAQEGLFWPMMLLGATTLVVIGVGVAIRDQTGQRVEDLEVLSTDLLVGSWWERDSMEDGDPTSDLVDHSEDFDSGVYSFQNGGVDGSSAG